MFVVTEFVILSPLDSDPSSPRCQELFELKKVNFITVHNSAALYITCTVA